MALMGWTLYDATIQERAAAQWVAHTQEVLHALDSVSEQLALAGAAQRGYLIAATPDFSDERDRSLQAMETAARRAASTDITKHKRLTRELQPGPRTPEGAGKDDELPSPSFRPEHPSRILVGISR